MGSEMTWSRLPQVHSTWHSILVVLHCLPAIIKASSEALSVALEAGSSMMRRLPSSISAPTRALWPPWPLIPRSDEELVVTRSRRQSSGGLGGPRRQRIQRVKLFPRKRRKRRKLGSVDLATSSDEKKVKNGICIRLTTALAEKD